MEDVTAEQIKTARQKFFEKVSATGADFHPKDVDRVNTDDLWIRRFCAHTNQEGGSPADMLYDALQWRKEFGTNDLTEKKLPPHLFEKGVLFIRNKDVFGKHLLIFKAKHHTKGTEDLDNLKKFIVYYFERIERLSKSDQISIVFDMEETGWSNMDMDFVRYLITLLKTYYPYFVNYLMIYEMPWLLNAAWKIIKGWLPPKFVDRVKFVNKKTMKEFIDADNMLADWGGRDTYKYKFEPEVPIPNGIPPTVVFKEPIFVPAEESFVPEESRSIQRATAFLEPVRKLNVSSSGEGGSTLADVTEHVVLTKDGTDKVCGRFQIRNVSSSKEAVLFKIKTTAPEKFHVRPTLGLLEWNVTAAVIINVNAMSKLRSINQERFQVQIIPAPKELLDGINGNQQEDLQGDLSKLWKKFVSKENRVENHRVGCSLDASITEAMMSPTGASLVTMNEEEMRKGLAQIEQRIVDKIQIEMKQKFSKVEKALYGVVGLLLFLLFAVWWAPSPGPSVEQVCRQ